VPARMRACVSDSDTFVRAPNAGARTGVGGAGATAAGPLPGAAPAMARMRALLYSHQPRTATASR
jgi:hypothetical protein